MQYKAARYSRLVQSTPYRRSYFHPTGCTLFLNPKHPTSALLGSLLTSNFLICLVNRSSHRTKIVKAKVRAKRALGQLCLDRKVTQIYEPAIHIFFSIVGCEQSPCGAAAGAACRAIRRARGWVIGLMIMDMRKSL
jgi:hypothetical protein